MENKYLQKTRTIWEIIRTDFSNNSTDVAYSMAVSPSGNYIYVAGYTDAQEDPDSTNTDLNFAVVKYRTSDGLRVKKFGNSSPQDGKLITNFSGNSNEMSYSIAISPDGDYIYVAGFINIAGDDDFAVVKYTTLNGTLVEEFGTNGKLTINIMVNSSDIGRSIAISPLGDIYVAGYTDAQAPDGNGGQNFAVVKYNSKGEPYEEFGNNVPPNGKLITGILFNSSDIARSIAISPINGHIYVAGFTNLVGDYDFEVVKYTSNGIPYEGFGNMNGGKLTTNFSGNSEDKAYSLVISPNDDIYVAGYTDARDPENTDQSYNFAVVKYNSDGVPYEGFGNMDGGKLTTNFSGNSEDKAHSLVISDDYIYVAGYTNAPEGTGGIDSEGTNFAVVKYKTSNGDPDDTFGNSTNEDGVPAPDGKLITNFSGNSADVAHSIAISPDGDYIYVAGETNAPEGSGTIGSESTNFAVVKYRTSDGKLATSVKEKMMTTNGIRF